ncbi:PilZ domain-containing protein [Desulfopila inferna]|uniref:PilZ domain-containing protein n=1 Tax=Desulfopila inferna TaxID=468528 RepID=UPI0019664617|nr:PilZ domain-containing protein [Desulfopila inferna]MBM9606056.1 PilZ domain-containing protein [Desulfopila inferna]
MDCKRIHFRVPLSGEALLSRGREAHIKAQAIDISQGGVAITVPEMSLPKDRYDIVILTDDDEKIELSAQLIRQTKNLLGFKTTHIDDKSFRIIAEHIDRYQETLDFIEQIGEHDFFQRFIDEDGNELDVTFNVDLDKP